MLGYSAKIAVNEEHLIVGQRVTVNRCDVPALLPMVEEVERQARARPQKLLADAAYTNANGGQLQQRDRLDRRRASGQRIANRRQAGSGRARELSEHSGSGVRAHSDSRVETGSKR